LRKQLDREIRLNRRQCAAVVFSVKFILHDVDEDAGLPLLESIQKSSSCCRSCCNPSHVVSCHPCPFIHHATPSSGRSLVDSDCVRHATVSGSGYTLLFPAFEWIWFARLRSPARMWRTNWLTSFKSPWRHCHYCIIQGCPISFRPKQRQYIHSVFLCWRAIFIGILSVCLSVRPSVRLSFTFRYCSKTA